jgi:hypothetical protein
MIMASSLFEKVIETIEHWQPKKKYFFENDYRDDLIEYLDSELNQYGDFSIRKEHGESRIDIGINDEIGIELKLNLKGSHHIDRLTGQLTRHIHHYRYGVILLLLGETDSNTYQTVIKSVNRIKLGSKQIKIITNPLDAISDRPHITNPIYQYDLKGQTAIILTVIVIVGVYLLAHNPVLSVILGLLVFFGINFLL